MNQQSAPRRRISSLLTLSLLLGLCCLPPLAAQGASTQGDAVDLFSEVVQVKVVNLEVVVADRSGNLVFDLGPEDFRIIVDGKEQPIDYFSEIQEGEALTSDLDGPPGVDPGRSVATNFLLYVDDNHTFKHERDQVVRGLLDDLSFLGPKDRMAVVVQTGTRLVTLSKWTSDRTQLQSALRGLLEAKSFGGSLRSPILTARRTSLFRARGFSDITRDRPFGARRSGIDAPFAASRSSFDEGRFFGSSSGLGEFGTLADYRFANAYAQRVDLEFAISGALSTMRGFEKPDGRKVMLMLTGEWPIGNFPIGSSDLNTMTELDIAEPLIETANLLGYTLYPINDQAASSVWRTASFNHVASRTGGRALFNRKDVLVDAVNDTRTYYWLGFSPTMQGDNQRHDVVVEVLRPGLEVRARNSYVDLSRNVQLAMDTQGALLFGEEIEASGITLEFGQPHRVGIRKMTVPATVTIPLDLLTSLRVGGKDQIQLELRFAVVDETGAQANVPMVPIILRGDNSEGEIYEYITDLLMRRRPHEVMVSVYDPASGQTLRSRSEIAYREGYQDR